MNAAAVRAIPEFGGFRAEYRRIHRTAWLPVRNGHLFATEADAKVAAHEALLGSLVGDGIVGSGYRAKAHADAQLVFPGKGRKPVQVERRGGERP